MKLIVINTLLVCTSLLGCAQTQVPYKVVKVTNYESKLLPVQFPLGVSQEKLGEKKYRITAKLAELGTPTRAMAMAFYHASILAETKGFNAFILDSRSHSSWCGRAGGGPTVKLIISLTNAERPDKENQLFLVETTRNANEIRMNKELTELELQQISAERSEHCSSQFSNRKSTTKRLTKVLAKQKKKFSKKNKVR